MPRRKPLSLLSVLLLLLLFGAQPCLAEVKPVVFFGINLRYSPRTMYQRYQPLMDYLTANTPYRFELLISRNYRHALRDLKEGRAMISSLGDGAFVDAILSAGAVPIVKPLNSEGKPLYRAAIVVPRDSSILRLAELRQKSFAFGSSHSITGNLVPRFMLEREGVAIPALDLRVNLKNHDAVTKAILKGQFEAGAVKDMFAVKYQPYGLRVLAYSEPLPSVPLVVRPDAPEKFRASVTAALLKLDPKKQADRRIMAAWDDEFQYGFAPASVEDYREVIRIFRAIPLGCGTRCHR